MTLPRFFHLARILCFVALLSACGQQTDNTTRTTDADVAAAPSVEEESARLNAWFNEKNEERLRFSPIELTSLGRKELYDQLDDFSAEGALEQLEWMEATVAEMEANFDYELLDFETRTSWDLWQWMAERARTGYEFRDHNYVFHQMGSLHDNLPTIMISYHVVDTESDMQAYISRISQIGRGIRQGLEQARHNAEIGVRPPRFSYEEVISSSNKIVTGKPFDAEAEEDSALLADGKGKIAALVEEGLITQERASELEAGLEAALLEDMLPAYEELIVWLEQDIVNTSEQAQGVSALPNGEAFYNAQLQNMTTLPLSAEQVHQTGLDEVARISAEMERVKNEIGFEGDMQAFVEFLNTDPQFVYPNTDEGRQAYLDDTTAFYDYIYEKLPEYFGILPKAPLVVKRVEAYREQDGAPQHYFSGSVDGSRPGIYYVHLSDTTAMPKTDMETVAYHEGLPGHHMQISIAQEQTGMPDFRGQVGHTAYVEGWALYSEKLAGEMGAYKDPYKYFGHLNAEIWRAIRLVVDTGIHAMGWSEQQAIDYFAANSSTPLAAITAEVQRYFVLPGQATAYKTGMLKIMELRELAEDELGDEFDIRDFHDVILGGGSLPLEILEKRVRNWLASK